MLKLKFRIKVYSRIVIYVILLLIVSCQSKQNEKEFFLNKDFSSQLSKGADIETIADHLIKVRKNIGTTHALEVNYPNLNIETAYKIQMAMLSKLEEQGEKLIGWKMGGSRVTDSNAIFQPVFGFMLKSNEFHSGSVASLSRFVKGYPLIEAEVGFKLKKDLIGTNISRKDVIDAIDSVGGFSELISIRLRDANGGINSTPAQAIADGLSHGGFIQPNKKYELDEIDLSKIKTQVVINGKVKAQGDSKGFAFVDAILYLANDLQKYGRHLHAGDIIITGSMLTPPPVKTGDKVEIKFSAFESLNIKFE